MLKKYGLKYTLATISVFFISFIWPISFFLLYMFKDEKDELKVKLLKKLEFISYAWIVVDIIAIIAKIISEMFESGII